MRVKNVTVTFTGLYVVVPFPNGVLIIVIVCALLAKEIHFGVTCFNPLMSFWFGITTT